MDELITIDGADGEGGGQVLRTSLALSLVAQRPFRIDNIRAGRAKPGLLRQHLTAVLAAAEICGARVSGAELGSRTLTFEPAATKSGEYRWAVGTAGSATLVFQTVLPALLGAGGRSRLIFEGGTHNPLAPPYDFLAKCFLPLLRRMGASIDAELETYGFYPAGGGRFSIGIDPCAALQPLELIERGSTRVSVRALVSALPEVIGKRELSVIRGRLGLDRAFGHVESVAAAVGPGNVVMIVIESDTVTEVVTGFGMKGVSAEEVATQACDEASAYLRADVPVGPYLADQLLVPMALAGGGQFRTLEATMHARTNAAVIQRFLDVSIAFESESAGVTRVTVGDRSR